MATLNFLLMEIQVARSTSPSVPALEVEKLLRLPDVLAKIPIGRASWWKGVKEGRYPPAVRLGPRTTCWRASDIDKLIKSL